MGKTTLFAAIKMWTSPLLLGQFTKFKKWWFSPNDEHLKNTYFVYKIKIIKIADKNLQLCVKMSLFCKTTLYAITKIWISPLLLDQFTICKKWWSSPDHEQLKIHTFCLYKSKIIKIPDKNIEIPCKNGTFFKTPYIMCKYW